MIRYYKINRESETGLKIKSILDRVDEFDKKLDELNKKYGFEGAFGNTFYLRHLEGVLFEKEPDMQNWKKVKGVHQGYSIRARCKDKELKKDLYDLNEMKIYRDEIDRAVGNPNGLCRVGLDYTIPEIYVLSSSIECKLSKDCEEISNIEYSKLKSFTL